MRPEDLVIADLDGRIVEGTLRPSSDLPTHVALYRAFKGIGGVVHTHSRYATSWAQARRPIPCLGTTHADYFRGPVPVTRSMSPAEIDSAYEASTGDVIAAHFAGGDPLEVPAVLVAGHGPFCWGLSAAEAAHNAVILEYVAEMAYYSVTLSDAAEELHPAHLDKHFLRKHGVSAYYGQRG
jgi:L-ribulose-5-phosphate 4-epimerase